MIDDYGDSAVVWITVGKGTTSRGCGKTQFVAALKGRDFQSRRKSPIKSTAASAAGSNIPSANDSFRSLFQSCHQAGKRVCLQPLRIIVLCIA
jgi:hypothetical protein